MLHPRFELCIINYGEKKPSVPLIMTGLRFAACDYYRVQKIIEHIRGGKAMGLISSSKIALVDVDLMAFVEDYNHRHPETVMSLKVKWSAFRTFRDVSSYPLYTRSTADGLYDGSLRLSSQHEWDTWLKLRVLQSRVTVEEYYALWGRTVTTKHIFSPSDALTDLELDCQLLTYHQQSDSPVSLSGIGEDGERVLSQLELLLSPSAPRTVQ